MAAGPQPSGHPSATIGETRRDAEISRLRKKLADKTRQCTELEARLQAAATAIAALHHDNQALRTELTAHTGTVVPLVSPRRSRPST